MFGGALGRAGEQLGSSFMSGVGSAGEGLGKGLVSGATSALGAAAVLGAGLGAQKLLAAGTKRRDFKEMMDLNPDLAPVQEENPRFFNASYTSLRRLNPTYGRDPVVAGSLLRRMMQNPEGAGTILAGTMKEPQPAQAGMGLGASGSIGALNYRRDF
jgi:hypothetical protein